MLGYGVRMTSLFLFLAPGMAMDMRERPPEPLSVLFCLCPSPKWQVKLRAADREKKPPSPLWPSVPHPVQKVNVMQ